MNNRHCAELVSRKNQFSMTYLIYRKGTCTVTSTRSISVVNRYLFSFVVRSRTPVKTSLVRKNKLCCPEHASEYSAHESKVREIVSSKQQLHTKALEMVATTLN